MRCLKITSMFEFSIHMQTNQMSEFCCLISFGSLKSKWASIRRSAFNHCPQVSLTFKTNSAFPEIWRAEGKPLVFHPILCERLSYMMSAIKQKSQLHQCHPKSETFPVRCLRGKKKMHCLFSMKIELKLGEKAPGLSLFRAPKKINKYCFLVSFI